MSGNDNGRLVGQGDGRIVLYAAKASGAFIYAEDVKEEGDEYVFDAEKTVIFSLQGLDRSTNKPVWAVEKMANQYGHPRVVRYLKSQIAFRQDCYDPQIRKEFIKVTTGLHLA